MILAVVLALALQSLPDFKEQVIERESGGMGYNSCLADINADGRMDIVLVTEKKDQVLWYENPTWKRHTIVADHPRLPEPITPFDVDGDGKPEIVIGSDWVMADTTTSGRLWLLKRPEDLSKPWTPIQIDHEPSMHRLTVVMLDGKKELVASCIMGRGSKEPEWEGPGAPTYLLRRPTDPFTGKWTRELITGDLHRVHGIHAFDWDGDGNDELLVASLEGIFVFKRGSDGTWKPELIAKGDPKDPGASEVRVSRLSGGRRYLAAVEPWHGDKVAVYVAPEWKRRVLLDTYKVGHGVVPCDLTGTGVDSLLLGFRGAKEGGAQAVVVLHPLDAAGEKWEKKVIDDRDMAADGVHAHDLDGDGDLDLVATGKGSNVKIYWNMRKNP